MQTQTQLVNGIDVEQLMATIEAIKGNTPLAMFQFRAQNNWLGGTHNRSTIKGFFGGGKEDDTRTEPWVMDCGEPPILCGHDEGANPVEYLLNALAGCVTTTLVAHGAARGIHIESIGSELEGDIDTRGFLGLSNSVPRGFARIRVTMRVKSDASPEQLAALAQYSPVFNTVSSPTPIDLRIVPA